MSTLPLAGLIRPLGWIFLALLIGDIVACWILQSAMPELDIAKPHEQLFELLSIGGAYILSGLKTGSRVFARFCSETRRIARRSDVEE